MSNLSPDVIHDLTESEDPSFDFEIVIDQVWQDLATAVPRPIVVDTVTRLMANYDDAVIRRFVPVLVRREATEVLRTANFTEVEAKFKLANPQLFWQLQMYSELAGYALSQPRTMQVWDTYSDTDQRRILQAGFSCRQRETRDGIEITLKSLDRAEGAIHRRSEWQLTMPTVRPHSEWPESPLRERVQHMIGSEPLLTLCKLEQTRVVRRLWRDDQPVAELSMDSVTIITGAQELVFHELEIELMSTMSEHALIEIAQHLQARWNLQPERRSKFEHALELIDADV